MYATIGCIVFTGLELWLKAKSGDDRFGGGGRVIRGVVTGGDRILET
ncbi:MULTISPECIES: hypothetical protein [Brasilonema]|nr:MULTISPECIES: hypothetical protein [Brasilonema]